MLFAVVATIIWLNVPTSRAASLASDNAGNYNNWTDGSNNGSGFGSWKFLNSGSDSKGEFLGPSTANNGGSRGIDSSNSTAFGLYAQPNNNANAIRQFTGGLAIGQTFSMKFDNGSIGNLAKVGFQLVTSTDISAITSNPGNTGTGRFGFSFTGGDQHYMLGGGTPVATSNGFTGDGMTTAFTLTGTDSYSFTVTFANGSSTNTEIFTGALGGTVGDSIIGVRIFNIGAGNGDTANIYANDLVVVPEPATCFGGICLLIVAGYYGRRRLLL